MKLQDLKNLWMSWWTNIVLGVWKESTGFKRITGFVSCLLLVLLFPVVFGAILIGKGVYRYNVYRYRNK